MNMSTALNNAIGGLGAASRGAAVVSKNIANVLTPGYARRSLELTTNVISGHGVRVVGVTRHQDPVLVANRRATDADLAAASTTSQFHTKFEALVGTGDDPSSIAARLSQFESSLITAASLPDSIERLDQATRAAKDLATSLNTASEGLRQLRSDSDRSIGRLVGSLNQTLADIEAVNTKIPSVQNSGGDIGALMDQRQVLIDQLNQIVPVNVIARDNNQVSIYSDGGLIMLEDTAAEFSFDTTGDTKPHMTVANGLLSGLTMNGNPVRVSGDFAQIRGGELAAQFEIRDDLSLSAQAELDTVAADLIERFETPGLDPTALPTDPGVFTDDGNRFDPTTRVGVASRIELNGIADPSAGGNSWTFRTGLGALASGDPGDATQLQAFGAILEQARPISGASLGAGNMRASELFEALASRAGSNAHVAETRQAFAASSQIEMERILAEDGVDSDAELQRMIQIEQAYAANARIISVVDELMDTLLRL